MIYVKSDSTDANFNFALEKYILDEMDISDEYFIFWRTTPTLMIGKFQNVYEEINMEYAKAKNINIVRRITGGGTIYTDLNGWQFSFINKDINEYKIDFVRYTKPIIKALKKLGVKAYLSGRNDLLIDGKKFSGNAQYNSKHKNLHHGSILFNTDLEELVRSLTVADEKIISKGIKSVKDRVVNVADYIDYDITSEEFRDKMLDALLQGTETYKLTDTDINRVNQIKQSQFDTWEWNIGKSPKFSITKDNRFAGGKLSISTNVEKGIIQDIAFYGDFFAAKDLEELRKGLIGTKYEENAVKDRLDDLNADEYFFKINKEEIISLII